MWTHNINPTLLDLGLVEIRWYGIVYVLGFLLAIYWLKYLKKQGTFQISDNDIWDLGFYLMIGVIVGARVFMIFWQPSIYLTQPLNLLKVWEGGMSFHGGFVGIIVGAWLFCKKKHLDFWKVADMLSAPAILALGLGRIANFINGELVGRTWDGNWCVVFPGYEECRHPSTLYAAAKRFLIFGWLAVLTVKNNFKAGFIFWNFVLWEGVGRVIVDFYREDMLYYGLSIGQWLSILMVLVAVWVLLKNYGSEWKKFK
jgi:phosphatidylglycerol---prolipoprotein diacylglyceryl transferase